MKATEGTGVGKAEGNPGTRGRTPPVKDKKRAK